MTSVGLCSCVKLLYCYFLVMLLSFATTNMALLLSCSFFFFFFCQSNSLHSSLSCFVSLFFLSTVRPNSTTGTQNKKLSPATPLVGNFFVWLRTDYVLTSPLLLDKAMSTFLTTGDCNLFCLAWEHMAVVSNFLLLLLLAHPSKTNNPNPNLS